MLSKNISKLLLEWEFDIDSYPSETSDIPFQTMIKHYDFKVDKHFKINV